ncbi:delta-like protein B [Penaeus chinensis]|uniref:delta-like protein B n=1 Tax=Penaeus chinensis TaxID=139456 RepID=UPI001FB61BA2|nr:delta-like protein B [Penaeus chinensis]
MLRYLLVLILLGISCRGENAPDPENPIAEPHIAKEDFVADRRDFRKLLEDMLSFFWDTKDQYNEAMNREAEHDAQSPRETNECPEKIENASCDHHQAEPMGGCCVDYGNLCQLKHGGKCFESWKYNNLLCNMMVQGICGNSSSCYCCIDCDARNSSVCAQTGGKCMKRCGLTMREVSTSCHSPLCSCCVSCNKGQCEGTCLGRESDCKSGYYMEPHKCIEDDCVCCIPCSVTAKCLAKKGYPERNTADCKDGYEANAAEAGPGCVCCQPTDDTKKCKVKGIVGTENQTMNSFCSDTECPPNYHQFTNGCEPSNEGCRYCVPGFGKCKLNENCEKAGGYCSQGPCKAGFYVDGDAAACSSADDTPCHCCKPDCARYS